MQLHLHASNISMGEDFIALKRQSATTTTTHRQMFCCIREHPNHFSLRKVNQNMTFILKQINKMSFLQSFRTFLFIKGTCFDMGQVTFYNWQLDDNKKMHRFKQTKVEHFFETRYSVIVRVVVIKSIIKYVPLSCYIFYRK